MAEPDSAQTDGALRLARMVERVEARGAGALDGPEVVELPRLYRRASDELARAEASDPDGRRAHSLRMLVMRAHGALYAPVEASSAPAWKRAAEFLLATSPRTIRAEWKLGLALLVGFYALTVTAFLFVRQDLELAFVLQDPEMVNHEIAQLRGTAAGEDFRGNFTFGLGESPQTAGWILAHNIGVSILFFASALVPPLFLLILGGNALMLGTYTAVAAHWGQAGAISSILWCHGTIELQMIVLAGMAGLVLVRAWIAPGPWTRAHAMTLESRRAWALLAPTIPLLFFSGLIEGYVSPHAPAPVRLGVAFATGTLLVLWIVLGGRGRTAPA
jgi:uncharacterized membrane protein SpoIIM required for sporulation